MENNEKPTKSKKPSDSKFCQQRLPAWQPMLTAKSAFPYFYIVGLIMIGLGILLVLTANGVKEKVVEYTNCQDTSGQYCSAKIKDFKTTAHPTCTCSVTVTLDEDFTGQVYLYYGLTNFYQNHRYYVRSRDDNQLAGNEITSVSSDCDPYGVPAWNNSLLFAPCGAIANSLFNDTLALYDASNALISATSNGTAWTTDKNKKYGKPSSWKNTIPPVSWNQSAEQRGGYNGDEEFMVWMRPAALPTFRKLYRIFTTSNGLAKGNYSMLIQYQYPVVEFGGTKFFVISTVSWMGGRNNRLGIAYLVVGCIHIILGVVFTIVHLKMMSSSDDTKKTASLTVASDGGAWHSNEAMS